MKKQRNQDAGKGRTRNWTFIVYPESAPTDWMDQLTKMYIESVVSPLHDKDTNPDGEVKKAHYHVLLQFPTVKSFNQVKEITDLFNCPIPQRAQSSKGVVRYMLHMDNPEKYQYNQNDIKSFNGADVVSLLKPTSSDRYGLIKEMIEFIGNNDITEMKELLDYSARERFDDWFPLLCDNSAYIIGEYIKSNRHRSRKRELTDSNKTEK